MPYSYDENQRAPVDLRKRSDSPLVQDGFGPTWDHVNARWHLWGSEATQGAFAFNDDQLLLVTTLAVAELQVSRSYEQRFAEMRIFRIFAARSARVTGRQRAKLRPAARSPARVFWVFGHIRELRWSAARWLDGVSEGLAGMRTG